MKTNHQTLLQIVNHVIQQHPELAETIRGLADRKLTETEAQSLSATEIFSSIYKNGLWGKSNDPSQPYFSGSGSHNQAVTSVYISAVSDFLQCLPQLPTVLDLGCGDFTIGSQLRKFCKTYIACDIVPDLIAFNKQKYSALDVDFRVLDLITDPLPQADVLFIRQVLQHLSNSQILQLIPKISGNFSWLVLTEHLPLNSKFTHNIDQSSGHHIRLEKHSGVVLTSPPFNLDIAQEEILCQARSGQGIVNTTVYRLRT